MTALRSRTVTKSTIGPRRRVGIFIIILAAGRSITSREYTRPRARARSSRSTTPGKIGTLGQETDRLYPFTTQTAQWMRLVTKSTSFRGAGRGFGPADFIKTSSCTRMEIFLPQGNAPNGRRDYCVRCLISSLGGGRPARRQKTRRRYLVFYACFTRAYFSIL